MNAREILPEEKLFQYNLPKEKGGGSYSGFSNFFRYKMLLDGGIWVDTDLYCLKPLPNPKYIFVQEKTILASCLLKVPPNSDFAKTCWKTCENKDPKKIVWGETGPLLVTSAVTKHCLQEYIQEEKEFFPIMYDETELFFEDLPLPNSYTVHFWNEMWRRAKRNKNAFYRPNTLYENLMDKYVIKFV